jgi:hypothetical protein
MTVAPVVPDDAPALLEMARAHGRAPWHILGGDAGIVARDEHGVAGFAFVREAPFGVVVDELWSTPDSRGREALSVLTDWLEEMTATLARERGHEMSLGGVVRVENAAMDHAMAKRGYEVVGQVRAKVIA